jgi:hypothetical protein
MSFTLRVNQSCYERGEGPAKLGGWQYIDHVDQEKRYTSVRNQTRNIRLWLWQSSVRKTSEVTEIVDGQPTQVIELDHPSYASIYTHIRIAPTQKQLLRSKLAPSQCRSWLGRMFQCFSSDWLGLYFLHNFGWVAGIMNILILVVLPTHRWKDLNGIQIQMCWLTIVWFSCQFARSSPLLFSHIVSVCILLDTEASSSSLCMPDMRYVTNRVKMMIK